MDNEGLKSTAFSSTSQVPPSHDDNELLSVGEIVAVLMEYRWLVAVLTSLCALIGAGYSFISSPVYKADSLIQVEETGGGKSAFKEELAPLLNDSTTIAAELEILTSRMVLSRVVTRLKLDIDVQPSYLSIFGSAVARRYRGTDKALNDPWFGLVGYAWGGEVLQVDSFDIPPSALNKPLLLTVVDSGSFEVSEGERNIILKGKVGERASSGGFSIFVPRMNARPGTRFILMRRSSETAIGKLRAALSVKERGKKSGILEVSFQGPDRELNARILDEILDAYLQQNVNRRSAEAESTLGFLESQLPRLKSELDSAEAAYNSYRQDRGSLDLSIETQSVLKSVVDVDNQIVALRQEKDELRQSFTAEHPKVQAVDQRIERLRERRRQFDGEVARLPDTQQKVLQLARDVQVSTTLYTNLLNTAQQLRVSKAGTVGNVRIIDSASAVNDPIGTRASAIVAIALIIGLMLSGVLIIILRTLRVFVEDPEVIESKLGLPVYAVIPHSDEEVALARRAKARSGKMELLAMACPEDDAVESLRGLRTTIHFALMDARHNSLLITGSSPGLGKSFVSKNLGAVLAQAGRRIVIVDADLRKGHLHREFGLTREIGVGEYVADNLEVEAIVKATSMPNLWVVTTGQLPPNPSELLMHRRFEMLIEKLGEQYDMVLVDAPPVLAVADAATIGRLTGAVLMVARAGSHPVAELEQSIKRLNQAGVQVKGFVFNDLNVGRQRYRYGYKGYVYRYSYKG